MTQIMPMPYVISSDGVSFDGHKIEGADPATFQFLNDYFYGKDKNRAYFYGFPIPGADAATFENIRWTYSRDKNNVYLRDKILEGADPKTFSYNDGDIFAKDKRRVYEASSGKVLEGADPATFTYVKGLYYKDKRRVYYGSGSILEGADPASFTAFEFVTKNGVLTIIGRDKKHAYLDEMRRDDLLDLFPYPNAPETPSATR